MVKKGWWPRRDSLGTQKLTEVAELLAVVVRFVCYRGLIHQRCASLTFYRRSLDGEELARAIVAVLTLM